MFKTIFKQWICLYYRQNLRVRNCTNEAQTSGLQCIAADCVPQETNIFNKVHFEKLEKNSWSEDILKFDNIKYNRQIDNKKINSSEV